MSAQPLGPDWWQASDGNWYPPEQRPQGSGGIEVSFSGPLEVQNWRPLAAPFLSLLHFVRLVIYGLAAYVYMVIAFFQVLFNEQISESTHVFLAAYQRYTWRVITYTYFMRNDSPRYGLAGGEYDPGDDRARLSIPRAQHLTRWGPLYKWVLAIPAAFVLGLYSIGAMFFIVLAYFQVLFTGTWSQNGRDFVVKVYRQSVRINAYLLLTDEKPPISPE